MALLVKYLLMISVMVMMLGVGLRIEYRQVIAAAKQFQPVLRGVLVNFLFVPALIYLLILWLPLTADVRIGIMLMAAAPIAPMAPPFVDMAKGDLAYAVGLMAIVALLSVPFTPLILSLALPRSEGGITLNPFQIIKILLSVQLIPICTGMLICRASPAWAARLDRFVPKAGQIGLVVSILLVLAAQSRQILSIGIPSHLFILVLVVGSLYAGDVMLIGDSAGRRRSLAISTAIRNIPLAFLIANTNFPGTAVAPVTLVFAVFSMVVAVVYGRLQSGYPKMRLS